MQLQIKLMLTIFLIAFAVLGSVALFSYLRDLSCGDIVWVDYDEYYNPKVILRECDII